MVFAYDNARNEFVCVRAYGATATSVKGARLGLGQQLLDWLDTNSVAKINSQPFLEEFDTAKATSLQFRSCLTVPLFADGRFSGVFAMYSTEREAFSQEHLRIVEGVSNESAEGLNGSAKVATLSARQ